MQLVECVGGGTVAKQLVECVCGVMVGAAGSIRTRGAIREPRRRFRSDHGASGPSQHFHCHCTPPLLAARPGQFSPVSRMCFCLRRILAGLVSKT
jgi:hypothetical protein